jgi:2-C-methyl-D-erythritol 4-phosphate cytidylyltransferase
MSAAAVVAAGGSGMRLGVGPPKQFRNIGDLPMLLWSCRTLRAHPDVAQLVVVLPADQAASPPAWLAGECDRVVAGGATRRESVTRGLAALAGEVELVLIHDGARPFISPSLVNRVLEAAVGGAAIPVMPVAETVKEVSAEGLVYATLDRGRLRRVQTPQGFSLPLIRELHGAAAIDGVDAPDDAFLCERGGVDVATVEGDHWNLKVTTPADMELARWLVSTGRVPRPAERESAGG